MKKKILITGASGFIGHNLKEGLSSSHELYCPNSQELNLLDTQAVKDYLEDHKFDMVIHCATHDASRNSNKDSNLILTNNLLMFYNLARSNNHYGQMFYFGSGAEYDKEHYKPRMTEEYFDSFVPHDSYGLSKYIMAKHISATDNIVDLRIFGCFGPYEDWEIRFISNAICKAIFDLDLTIKQNVVFDYLYIKDLVKIINWFVKQPKLKYKHYNVCTGNQVDLQTLAEKIVTISGKKLNIKVGEPGLKPEYSGDNSRLMAEIGDFAFIDTTESIKDLYTWYEKHIDKIDPQLLLTDK